MASGTSFKKCENEQAILLPSPTTREQSGLMIKKLTGVCVSTIAFLRNLFDSENFETRSLCGQNVQILKRSCHRNNGVDCLLKWLKGVFDALDNKYLKTVSLEIRDVTGLLLETYEFHYTFHDDQPLLNIETSKNIHVGGTVWRDSSMEEIRILLRNILVATSAQPILPPNCFTSVRIHYHDGTPEDYEPPGFKPFFGESPDHVHPNRLKLACGQVSTKFHTLNIKTKLAQTIPSSSEPSTPEIRCECGLEDRAGSLLKCETCGTLQHLACYKIFSEENSQSQRTHKCIKCGNSKPPKDFDAVSCLFRRVIALCAKSKSVSIKKLTNELNLNPDSALVHMKKLQREGALQKSIVPICLEKTDFMHTVNKSAIDNFKVKYFN
ncbi:HORMA domain-containing protein 2-like [Thrips palmi]|uniref:HORMA domain-containing protein 2-like n=1 Tax=Thrips palmi TaxID=161013 RepID=A0A6P9ACA1_THRPL|nr:HORMA domain-containing protein 2-like [Thrips palmi]XP_034255808.1 HORMA domain-containing protein 2-like [Thrips palmi]